MYLHLINSILLAQNPSATTVIIVIILVLTAICYILYRVFGHKGEFDPTTLTNTSRGEGGDGTKGNGDIPSEQVETSKKGGGGDSNGNEGKPRGVRKIHVIKMVPSIATAHMDSEIGAIANDDPMELLRRVAMYDYIQGAAELFIKNHKEGIYNGKPNQIKRFIDTLILTLKNWKWDIEKDVTETKNYLFLRLIISMLQSLTHIKDLNEMDPDLWIGWVMCQQNRKRVLAHLIRINNMAQSYLEQSRKIPYFYITRFMKRVLEVIKFEIPDGIKSSIEVPEELRAEFLAFNMQWNPKKHWEDAIQMERTIALTGIAEEMANEFAQGVYNEKDESVKALIEELFKQRTTGIIFSNSQYYYDIVSLLESLHKVTTEDEIDPILWVNYLRWLTDGKRVVTDLEKIHKIAKDRLFHLGVEPYFYILNYCRTAFEEFSCEIPDEIREYFQPESELEEQYKEFVKTLNYLGHKWVDVIAKNNEPTDNEGSPQQGNTKSRKRQLLQLAFPSLTKKFNLDIITK